MNWDERAERWATVLFQPVPVAEGAGHMRERGIRLNREAELCRTAFVRGARWQREALLSDESIERAALGIHASHDRGDWDEELPVVQDEYLDMARAALTAAMGEDEK